MTELQILRPPSERSNPHVFAIKLNLPYAYTWYDVRVKTRVKYALYGDALWSNHSSIAFQSAPRNPDIPPHTNMGAFQILESNEFKIFWKQLGDHEKNGANLTYEIVEVLENDVVSSKVPKEPITKMMARFNATKTDVKYTIKIISRNSQGRSLNESEIVVPRRNDRIAPPRKLKKDLFRRQYTLTWEKPTQTYHQPIENYTIFWCDPQDEQTQLCEVSENR